MLVEDRSIGGFPDWFNDLGQHGLVGPLTLSHRDLSRCWRSVAVILLHFTGFGRRIVRHRQQRGGGAVLRRPRARASR